MRRLARLVYLEVAGLRAHQEEEASSVPQLSPRVGVASLVVHRVVAALSLVEGPPRPVGEEGSLVVEEEGILVVDSLAAHLAVVEGSLVLHQLEGVGASLGVVANRLVGASLVVVEGLLLLGVVGGWAYPWLGFPYSGIRLGRRRRSTVLSGGPGGYCRIRQ